MARRWVVCLVVTMTERLSATARLFGPGLPGSGCEVAIDWWAGRLRLTAEDGQSRALAISALQSQSTGFNATQHQLTWQENGQSFALHLDSQNRQILASHAPNEWHNCFQQASCQQRFLYRRFRFACFSLAALLLLPVLALALFILNIDKLTDWGINHLPHHYETRLGELALAQVKLQNRLNSEGLAVRSIEQIGKQLTPDTPYNYRWFVSDSKDINAFALPGGIVVVNAGLIQAADSAEEVAGVIAHEVAHTELRHGTRSMLKSLGLRTLAVLFFGDWGSGVAGDMATQLLELRFSRQAENEADRDGLARLQRAGIATDGLLTFFKKLEEKRSELPELPSVLSTHPLPSERIAALTHLQSKQLGNPVLPLAIDWQAVQKSLQ